MFSRRMLLKSAGAAVLVSGTAGAWWVGTRTPREALEPWSNAGDSYEDPRLDALAYAVLAPNPHNRQPWQVNLVGKGTVDLYCDLDRRLPDTDPFDRQTTIGLGCFIELFSMAAKARGYHAEIVMFPAGEPERRLDQRPIARMVLKSTDSMVDPLFDTVFDRRSTKEVYDIGKPVVPEKLASLIQGKNMAGTVEAGQIAALREITWQGHEIEMLTPSTLMESVNLMRFGKAEIEANPDGIDFSGVKFELLNKTGLMTRESIADPTSPAFAQGMEIFREMLFSAMGYIWLTSPDNTRRSQLVAGREWVRINLRATQLGLAVHPLSQALQEYKEMTDLYTKLHEMIKVEQPSRIQMFARIGYGPKVEPSPRWPIETRLVDA